MDKVMKRQVGFQKPVSVKDRKLQNACENILGDPNLKKELKEGLKSLIEDNKKVIPATSTNGKPKSAPKKTGKGKNKAKSSQPTKTTVKKEAAKSPVIKPKMGRPPTGVNTKIISFSVRKEHADQLRAFMFAKILELKK